MDDAQLGKQVQGLAHAEDEVTQQLDVCSDSMIEVTVMNHIDPLTLIELSLNIKEVVVHGAPRAQFINQPQVFFIFD
jgi:hypothetical protein